MFIKVLSKNNKSYIINTDYIVKMYEHEDHITIIFNNKASIYTWLYRIAINESLDFIRSQKNNSRISSDQNEGLASKLLADEYFDGDEIQAHLQEAISLLPDVQRSVFCLRYFDEMKYSEMSTALGTSEGALKASYHLAVKKIAEFFKLHD